MGWMTVVAVGIAAGLGGAIAGWLSASGGVVHPSGRARVRRAAVMALAGFVGAVGAGLLTLALR